MKKKTSATGKLYDTPEKQITSVKKKGQLITFKKPFHWKGDPFWQILVEGLEKQQGAIKIVGFTRDTPWYDNMDDLLKAIDWDKMERWHSADGY